MKNNNNKFFMAIVILCVLAFASTGYALYSTIHYFAVPNQDQQINIQDTITTSITLKDINGGQKVLECIETKDNSVYKHVHEAAGVEFVSSDSSFNKEKLRKVADELLRNSYGDEIELLSKVEVIVGDSEAISAECKPIYEHVALPLSLNGILPENAVLNRTYENSIITLNLPDEDADFRDYAFFLSREYGRHFTKFNFNLSLTDEDINSDYYQIRAAGYEDRIILDASNGVDDNLKKWTLSEIAAYDYVYLLGSDTAHNVEEFKDTLGKHHHNVYGTGTLILADVLPYFAQCINGVPHINPSMDMPVAVDGLTEYFYSFVDKEHSYTTDIAELGTLELRARKSSYYQQYITWNQPFSDPDVIYTLIAYDEYDNIVAIAKTTDSSDDASASLGVYDKHGYLPFDYRTKDQNDFHYELGDIIRFRISVTFPDGTVLLSDFIEKVY